MYDSILVMGIFTEKPFGELIKTFKNPFFTKISSFLCEHRNNFAASLFDRSNLFVFLFDIDQYYS